MAFFKVSGKSLVFGMEEKADYFVNSANILHIKTESNGYRIMFINGSVLFVEKDDMDLSVLDSGFYL